MKKNMLVYPVSVLLAVGLLAGCAAMPVQAASGRTAPAASTANPKAGSKSNSEAGSKSNSKAGSNSNSKAGSKSNPKTDSEPEFLTASPTVDAIAGLGELKARVEESYYKHPDSFKVDVENGHNPYDVEWDYGELYDVYVEEADWSLVFDADFYMKSFPALALLYHYDEELLLEHFQTMGIHEGRQGNKAFNVAAYQKNCKKALRDAFGDHYECYYFYWMLNQNSQKGVTTSGKNYPLQLCAKMTYMQAVEFENVNKYRAEVGVKPLKFDPELAAIACYRGWVDISEGYGAHDWLEDKANEERVNAMIKLLHMDLLGENTVDCGMNSSNQYVPSTFYINYRYSPDHYEAMINPKYKYFGSSHIYFGNNRIPESKRKGIYDRPMMSVEFDLFTGSLSTPVHP